MLSFIDLILFNLPSSPVKCSGQVSPILLGRKLSVSYTKQLAQDYTAHEHPSLSDSKGYTWSLLGINI